MKGPYHEQLRALLADATKRGVCTQESLARAMGKTQTSVGAYLRVVKGGALDLDEADAALRHIGSSLPDFVAAKGRVTPKMPAQDVQALELMRLSEFAELVSVLHAAPPSRLPSALRHAAAIAIELARARRTGSRGATSAANGTSKGPKRRR